MRILMAWEKNKNQNLTLFFFSAIYIGSRSPEIRTIFVPKYATSIVVERGVSTSLTRALVSAWIRLRLQSFVHRTGQIHPRSWSRPRSLTTDRSKST